MINERDESRIKEAVKSIDSDILRQIVKDAIKELVGEQVQAGGFWLLRVFGVATVGAVILFILWANGWVHK